MAAGRPTAPDPLARALDDLARARRCITYAELAACLGDTAPGRIGRVSAALEALMERDARDGRPLRAALVLGRAQAGLPGRGFFLKAQELGLCPAPLNADAAAQFHADQLMHVFEDATGAGDD